MTTSKYLIIFLLSLAHQSFGQSLSELIDLATKESKDIQLIGNAYQVALQKAPQVSQFPNPVLGVGGFPLPVQTRVGPQIVRLSATQMFPQFGLLGDKVAVENSKAKVILQQVDVKALQIAYGVKQNYYQLYELRNSQQIIQKNMDLLNSLERLAEAKIRSGKSSAADVVRIQLNKEKLKQKLAILKSNESIPLIRLNELLERPLDTEIEINQRYDLARLNYNKETILANISEKNPALIHLALQQEVAKKAIELNRSNKKPSFGVGMDYILVANRKDVEIAQNGRDILQVRASVTFPIQKKKFSAKEEEEKLKMEGLELQKANLLNEYEAQIAAGFAQHQTAEIEMQSLEKQITLTQSAIQILLAEYAAKGKNFDELLQLEMDLISYELQALKAIVASHYAKNNIERFMVQ